MKFLALCNFALLCGQSIASVHCTVVQPDLVKRMCEFDNCPSIGYVKRGQLIHAACLADCSTLEDPWVKLFDDTFIRAKAYNLKDCHTFGKDAAIRDLPRCHSLDSRPKPTDCAIVSTSPLSRLKKSSLSFKPLRRAPHDDTSTISSHNASLPESPDNSTVSANPTVQVSKSETNAFFKKWYKRHAVRSLRYLPR
ncbi:hypothetical protein B0T21DRAFT_409375 [Apiosordaria backusii]|uniref:Secreted protein n=1 Tax=Apiosordaria backusii TaxID=314023 RepID=A0AA40K1N7_9PEZI|nr:hypothetical protein B0T21DRAFT_409375 [Apiosordaria backusii]